MSALTLAIPVGLRARNPWPSCCVWARYRYAHDGITFAGETIPECVHGR